MKTPINYKKGDATALIDQNNKIIVHVCNDVGGWGKGFVVAISNRWEEPERKYREWYKSQENFRLGQVQFVQVASDLWIANLIGQHQINRDENGNPPIRYEAINSGLAKVADFAQEINASIHMPRIGCGLAGGNWDQIEPLIEENLSSKQIFVTVYDF